MNSKRLIALGMLALAYVTTFFALAHQSIFFIPSLGMVLLMELLFVKMSNKFWLPAIVQHTLPTLFRLLTLRLLVTFFGVYQNSLSVAAVVLPLVIGGIALRAFALYLNHEYYRHFSPTIAWRNLPVKVMKKQMSRNWLTRMSSDDMFAEIGIVLTVLLIVMTTDAPAAVYIVPLALIFAVRLGVVGYLLRELFAIRRIDPAVETKHAVKSALKRYAPQVVVFIGGYQESVHAVNVWTPTLDLLSKRTLIVVCDRWHLNNVKSENLPVLLLPTEADIHEFIPDSVQVALYPTNIARNMWLVNKPGIYDIFIGHGDSDKGSSANPISKVYDEIWVAGPAAIDRYVKNETGIPTSRIREVGRPQLVEIRQSKAGRKAPDKPFTVLYAPTWEGPHPEWTYSSLPSGREIIARLLEIPNVRVLYKPHPSTGSKNKDYTTYNNEIKQLIRDAGPEHRIVSGLTGLYESFNQADLLISDISSVITDFLYSRKPYIVTNMKGQPEAEFYAEFPSSKGAALIDATLTSLIPAVEDAMTEDSRKAHRVKVANYLLGSSKKEPIKRFDDALGTVIKIQKLRRKQAEEERLRLRREILSAQPLDLGESVTAPASI